MFNVFEKMKELQDRGFSKQDIYEILVQLQMQDSEQTTKRALEEARKARTLCMN